MSRRFLPVATGAFLGLLVACGTVAGNPKKAEAGGKPSEPPASGVVEVALPLIEFDIADETFASPLLSLETDSDPSLFSLAETDVALNAERGFFNAYGRRVNALVRELNRTAKRTNELLAAHGKAPVDVALNVSNEASFPLTGSNVISFENKGKASKLSALIRKTTTGREAVLCVSGKPFQVLRWNTAGTSVELWRDFRVSQGDGETSYGLVSQLRATKNQAGEVMLDVASLGTWRDEKDAATSEGGLAERVFARKVSSKEMTLRAVTDRFQGAVPPLFEADSYLVSHLLAHEGGRRGFKSSFVAFSSAPERVACRNGFDEAAEDLWSPLFTGPRFCMGRPFEGGRFESAADFRAHVAKFERIGIARRSDIIAVTLPSGAKCTRE